jgi:glyoxylase-like metal-dependent hydrolase (beta-lactamase superfamily II)
MASRHTQQVAPSVERLGDEFVNFYLVDHSDGRILVDAGLPGHLRQIQDRLTQGDIRAVLLTHGHLDHTGLVAAAQRSGADIWIHEADAPILVGGPRSSMRLAKPERSFLPYLMRRPAAIRGPLHLARLGGFGGKPVQGARTFRGEQILDDVPGRPQVVAMPGHTQGSVAFHFPEIGVLFTGDALVTHEDLVGHTGPTLVSRGFTNDSAAALASLDRLAQVPMALLLPGHGDPYLDGPQAAAAAARRVSPA